MPSKKPIYKKPHEPIERYEECSWLGNDTPFFENENTAIFWDRYPVTRGHLLFIPKKDTPECVGESYKLAYYCGEQWIQEGKMDGFNIGQNRGQSGWTICDVATHTSNSKKNGDSDPDKHNGIRLSHPRGDHTNYY
jgi:diadenosine tetraphosphate (Ap4A) HIT family hydrolase